MNIAPLLRSLRPIVLPHWGVAEVVNQKSSSPGSVVTKLDIELEEILKRELAKAYPDVGFVGEESGGDRTAKQFWLIDPIDGTGTYIRGLPFCTIMIALINDGQVIFSAIYDFINDHVYWAERGKGAFKDNDPIHVSNRPLGKSYIGYESRIEKPENLKRYLEVKKKASTISSLAAGWEYIMVASGKLDARINVDPYGKDYDFAPGALLVSEAGGIVANLGTEKYDYKNTSFIASNPAIYKELTLGKGALFPIK